MCKSHLCKGNVEIVHSRCENFQSTVRFDSIIFRAVGGLATVIDWTRQLLAKNGRIVAMKGREPDAELLTIPEDFAVTQTASLKMSGIDRERQIIVLQRK